MLEKNVKLASETKRYHKTSYHFKNVYMICTFKNKFYVNFAFNSCGHVNCVQPMYIMETIYMLERSLSVFLKLELSISRLIKSK